MSWLPDDFVHPVYTPVLDTGLHLRPIRETDTALDYPAVMGSRERLWGIFGPAWSWPRETMTYEEDRLDLLRHEKEIAAHQSFNYALLDDEETAILGCVYIDPPERTGSDGEVAWWVVDDLMRQRRGACARRAGAALDRRRLALPCGPAFWVATLPGGIGSRCRPSHDTSEAIAGSCPFEVPLIVCVAESS